MFISDLGELFLPEPIYLVGILIALCIAAFHSARQRAMFRWRWAFAVVALWSWLFSAPAVANLVLAQLEGTPGNVPVITRSDAGAVIVLSSGQLLGGDGARSVRMDEHGWERLYEGISVWRKSGGRLIFTGGPPGTRGDSMADLMSRLARDSGVPAQAIAASGTSWNTYEELLAAKDFVADRTGPVLLVTSAAHMPRALAVSQKLGLPVVPYPVDYRQLDSPNWMAWLPHNGGPRLFELALHELIGYVAYKMRGWS